MMNALQDDGGTTRRRIIAGVIGGTLAGVLTWRTVGAAHGQSEAHQTPPVVPDTAKEKPQRGTVIAVGKGRRDEHGGDIPLDVSVGDSVLFAEYADTETGG